MSERHLSEEEAERFWHALRSNPDDLRKAGLSVAIHHDYRQDGKAFTFWLMTAQHDGQVIALKGEGETDEEALDLTGRLGPS
jgi:hypothetical protein